MCWSFCVEFYICITGYIHHANDNNTTYIQYESTTVSSGVTFKSKT